MDDSFGEWNGCGRAEELDEVGARDVVASR